MYVWDIKMLQYKRINSSEETDSNKSDKWK